MEFDEARFRRKVDKALESVRTILDNDRKPQLPEDVPHSYDDKYLLAEYVTNSSLSAQINVLQKLGFTADVLKKVKEWVKTRTVTLRFKAEERCAFIKETSREEEDPTKHVTEFGIGPLKSKWTSKVMRTIVEYFWAFEVDYELFLFPGNDPDDKIVLQSRHGEYEIMTTVKTSPRPESAIFDSKDLNMTWFLQQFGNEGFTFNIDREDEKTRTPRRNAAVNDAEQYFRRCYAWRLEVYNYFTNTLFPVQTNHGLDLGVITASDVFTPILPLFEKQKETEPVGTSQVTATAPLVTAESVVLPEQDLNLFLEEQKRTIDARFDKVTKVLPADQKLITVEAGQTSVCMLFLGEICSHFLDGINYIEDMLRKQLVAAIGKEVDAVDFTNYMVFHNRKLYKEEYEPRPFSYAIRRPDHYPEGTLSIESQLDDGSIAEPVYTTVRSFDAKCPVNFSIDAATTVSFLGQRYLHSYIGHQFAGASGSSLRMVARARQFSCFMLLVGRITGPDQFAPESAIIVQNKDELNIPLWLETIPTPKEFRDAIESLSPEQQRFCKAFRAMQLESTLFGICVIQIKPQLEKLLKLNDDSLTKEIRLTQDLLELFIKYQIPCDLLSYDGDEHAGTSYKVEVVQKYVAKMNAMIQRKKDEELAEQKRKAEMARLEQELQYQQQQQQEQYRMASAAPSFESYAMECAPSMDMCLADDLAAPMITPLSEVAAPEAPSEAPSEAPAETSQEETGTSEQEAPTGEAVDGDKDIECDYDFTQLPKELDAKFQELDLDSALRPTILNTRDTWTKKFTPTLISEEEQKTLGKDALEESRKEAFDLLDALSRSGVLVVDQAELHVVVAATHCFDRSLINTIVQDNVNPIEKVERSGLIVATTIHGKSAEEMVKEDQLERVRTYSPNLF